MAERGFIILLIGLPAVGKSTLSAPLARELGATILDRDDMTRAIVPPACLTWTRAQVKLAGEVCARVVETVLREQPWARIIIDGFTFSRKVDVDSFVRVAERCGCDIYRIECVADEAVVRRRIEGDAEGLAKRRDWSMYTGVRDRFELLEWVDLRVDLTEKDVGPECARVVEYIRQRQRKEG